MDRILVFSPVFDIETHNYAFYMPESHNVTVNCDDALKATAPV